MVNVANRDRDRDRGKDRRKGGRFEYKAPSAESMKKRAEQSSGGFDQPWKSGVDVWRPKQGDNEIRILPPTWDDHEHFAYDVYVHSFIGADQGTFLCLSKMFNEHCPCCDEAKEARAAGEVDEAKALQARKLAVCWIIDRDDKAEQPQLWPMSWTIDRDISALAHNKRTGKVLLVDHPEAGFDISFKRQGAGLRTKYFGMSIARDSSPICGDQDDQDKVLDYVMENPIPDILVKHDPKYMERAMDGTAAKKDDDLDEKDRDQGRGRDRGGDKDDKDDKDGGRERPSRDRDRGDDRGDDRRERSSRRGGDDDREEDRPRGGRRGRDEEADKDDGEKDGRRERGSDRDDDRSERRRPRDDDKREDDKDDKDDRRERSRDRDERKDDDPPGRRRGRDEESSDEDRPRRGRRDEESDKDDKDDKDEGRERGRGRDDDKEESDRPRRSRR